MKRVFESDLSRGKMRHMIAELRRYRDQTLPRKNREFLERLADIGVTEAEENVADTRYKTYVLFGHSLTLDNKQKKIVLMFGRNKEMMMRYWYTPNAVPRSAEVNPMMMLEFGSGKFAQDGWRGTFPGQHLAHFDYWEWYEFPNDKTTDETTVVESEYGLEHHRSSGEMPRMPMEMAYSIMARNIAKIAEEVFSTD